MYLSTAVVTLSSAALGAMGAFMVQRYSYKKSLERDHQNRVWAKKEELYIAMVDCMKSVEFFPPSMTQGSDKLDESGYNGIIRIVEDFLDKHLAAIHLYLDDDAPLLGRLNAFLTYVRGLKNNYDAFDTDTVTHYISEIVRLARADLGMLS